MTIRPIGPDEVSRFRTVLGHAFAFDPRPESEDRFRKLYPLERTRCAFDGDRLVGTLACLELELTVPGGVVAAAGTTMVAVLPSHRRRGLLRRMMDAHLEDARERGEPLVALWASDSAIYGRFGFGMAAWSVRVQLDTRTASFHGRSTSPAQVDLLAADEAKSALSTVFDRARRERPGMFARSPEWWEEIRLRDDPDDREGATSYRYGVAHQDGHPTGYVQYRVKGDWDDHGRFTVKVQDAVALTPEAAAGLWRLLVGHDLAVMVEASNRPVDDHIFGLLAGPRRAAARLVDGLWIRILDLPAAFEARGYRTDGRTVLEVQDPLGLVDGTWSLEVDGGRATVSLTDEAPDLRLGIDDLAALYLGRADVDFLHTSGRVTGERRAWSNLVAMTGWTPQPWCQEVF
jgi:predicted acetyltransferase